ncbi:RluA family pseudouridine synthase [Oceanobacillus polygoni]|uniref:RNA pseudouridylate synthase n=1 Tax=Oceanobacillus polygoni TaxID=1235259 RepID=A0A9X0YPX8_9BACI|nr:RluA family pseudouridine synthase [Oceanobacillus polygoni]MBP2076928.1 23S rRNA pseudouridine1911/1915/1917 synthase [Oceanobacillus polygoni]
MEISVLYEDNHLLLVEKPVNIPVQADRTGDNDFLSMLKQDLKVRYQKPGNVFLGLVHRLDRPVGGAMVFAKTSKAASRMSDLVRRQAIERKYLAVVRGMPTQTEAKLEHYLLKNNRENKVYTVAANHKQAKKAVLDYKVIANTEGLSLLSVQLHTGRPHQIRVQLSSNRTPIYGDQKYGQKVNRPGQQIALWAHTLRFEHPIKKEIIEVTSSPPEEKHPWGIWGNL